MYTLGTPWLAAEENTLTKEAKQTFSELCNRCWESKQEAQQYIRWARIGLGSTVKVGQRIQCDMIKRTLKATVHEVICWNGSHARS